jgi:hypothetical protein
LFGSRYPVTRYEVVTDLCPPDLCERPPGQPLRQALTDASVVYQHRVLPEALRDGLPDIDHSWGNFGDGIAGTAPAATTIPTTSTGDPDRMAQLDKIPESDSGRAGQGGALVRQFDMIGSQPSIHFVHVLLPHHPYVLTPWGGVSPDTWIPRTVPVDADEDTFEFIFREIYAQQALQIAAVDQMIGHLVDHLKRTGAWDSATLVITSDHGIDTTKPVFNRSPLPENVDELYRVPLFIKAPGQTEGETRDDPASTVDVLPSLIDLLDIEADWTFDGHSLFDGSQPKIDRLVTSDLEDAFAVAARQNAQFPRGESWDDLAAVGQAQDLVGRPVTQFTLGTPSPLTVTFDQEDLLADLDPRSGEVPYSLRGTLTGTDTTPPELAVALNGTFAGTIGGYRPDGDTWLFSGLMANYFVDGPNDVTTYQIERTANQTTLHEVAVG